MGTHIFWEIDGRRRNRAFMNILGEFVCVMDATRDGDTVEERSCSFNQNCEWRICVGERKVEGDLPPGKNFGNMRQHDGRESTQGTEVNKGVDHV